MEGAEDVHTAMKSCGWGDLMLQEDVLNAITQCGYEHPSEVQHRSIPFAKIGKDVIVQAKSGMGKTAVYAISILHQDPEPSPVNNNNKLFYL